MCAVDVRHQDMRHARTLRGWVALAGVLALFAGCVGTTAPLGTPGPTASASPNSPAPSASPAPTVTPTPSPGTPSPSPSTAQLLRRYAAASGTWRASATLTGTIGGTLGTVKGTFAAFDDDATLSLTTRIAGKSQATEQILVGDASYLRAAGGTWRRDLPADGMVRAVSLRAALLDASYEELSAATATTSGRDAARIAEALGLVDPGVVPGNATARLGLDGRGNLARLDLGFDASLGRWELTYSFAASPSVTTVSAPKDAVVLRYLPKQVQLFYPDGWKLSPVGKDADIFDLYTSPTAEEIVIVYCIPTKQTLKQWTEDGRGYYSKELKAKISSTGSQDVNGLTGNVTQWTKATSEVMDAQAYVVNVAAVHGGLGCDIQWQGPLGGAGASNAISQFAGSFEFLN